MTCVVCESGGIAGSLSPETTCWETGLVQVGVVIVSIHLELEI